MFQKEGVERERDGKYKEGEDEKGKLPSSKRDQVLDQRDQDKNSKSNPYPSKTICSPPFSFEPVGKDYGKGSDAETSDAYSNNDPEKEIEL
jgi:hypothetical protein